jgi:hypothetical protein
MPSETTPQQQRTQYQQRLQQLTDTLNQHTTQKHNIEIRKATTQTSLTEYQKQLDQAQQLHQKTNQDLQTQLQKSPFPNIHALQTAILTPLQLEQYQLQQQQLTERNTQNNTRLQDTTHKLHRQQQNPPTQTDKQTLQHQKQQANQQILDLQQQIATNNHTLHQNEQLTKQYATLIQHIKNLETQYQPLQQLHDLIGSSDGKKFRAFAQGLTLQHLLRKANQYLQTLSGGRYPLRPTNRYTPRHRHHRPLRQRHPTLHIQHQRRRKFPCQPCTSTRSLRHGRQKHPHRLPLHRRRLRHPRQRHPPSSPRHPRYPSGNRQIHRHHIAHHRTQRTHPTPNRNISK